MSICLPSSAAIQCLQAPQGVSLGPCSQTKAREKILALEVFPLPLSPEKDKHELSDYDLGRILNLR